MPLLTYDSKAAIPDGLGENAKEITEGDLKGKWQINVVPKEKLDEFRENNTTLAKKAETLEAQVKGIIEAAGGKFDGFEIEAFKTAQEEMRTLVQGIKDGKIKPSELEAELARRTDAMREKHDRDLQAKQVEIATIKGEKDTLDKQFRRTFIDRAISQVIADDTVGVQPMAMMDIANRAYGLFTVEESGKLVPKREGQTVWGEDGATPMTVKEWVSTELRKDAPHYFKPSKGGGAAGGGSGGSPDLGGHTQEAFNKLRPEERLRIANRRSAAGK